MIWPIMGGTNLVALILGQRRHISQAKHRNRAIWIHSALGKVTRSDRADKQRQTHSWSDEHRPNADEHPQPKSVQLRSSLCNVSSCAVAVTACMGEGNVL